MKGFGGAGAAVAVQGGSLVSPGGAGQVWLSPASSSRGLIPVNPPSNSKTRMNPKLKIPDVLQDGQSRLSSQQRKWIQALLGVLRFGVTKAGVTSCTALRLDSPQNALIHLKIFNFSWKEG